MDIPAAQLWFGSPETLRERAGAYAQKVWCRAGGCNACVICRHVQDRSYYALMWLTPEKSGYTVAQLDVLEKRMACMADPGEQFLIIFERAQTLSIVCSNRLLKVVEEPPPGYHFLLLAESQTVVPTLASRCIIEYISPSKALSAHPMVEFFTQHKFSVDHFMRVYAAQKITESETMRVLDELITYWQQRCHTAAENTDAQHKAMACIDVLMHMYKKLPMPGSNVFFWRTLYVMMKRIE